MKTLRIFPISCALALAALMGTSAGAQERLENPEGDWVHSATNTHFPREIGAAERTSITAFTSDQSNVAVGYAYDNEEGSLTFTTYVYPVITGMNCRETYEDSKAAIEQYKGAKLVGEANSTNAGANEDGRGYYGRYTIPEGSLRESSPEMISDVYLYCPVNSGYLVKYRASWTGRASTFPYLGGMLDDIRWGDSVD